MVTWSLNGHCNLGLPFGVKLLQKGEKLPLILVLQNQLIMKKLISIAVLFMIFLSSCSYFGGERIRGNGVIKTENRTAGTFNGIDVSGNTDVYVKEDSVISIRIEADENLLQYIIVENNNGKLVIHQKEGTDLKPTKSIKVYVSGPSINYLAASGACDFYSENQLTGTEPVMIDLSGSSDAQLYIKAPKVEAGLSGAGTITLKGEAKELRVDGSGSTDIRCFELMTESTYVELSGAGNAEVFASVKLDVHVSGAADVRYKGNPEVSQNINGAGSVKKAE
jgi:hypothetical protein